jgi:hypothetical protein
MVDKIPLLRQALAGLQRSAATQKADTAQREAGTSKTAAWRAPDRHVAATLEQRVRQRIAQIGPDCPQRRRRALRVIVEASLLQEFGERLDSDPAFHEMVEQVVQTMEDDPALRAQIDLALREFAA